MWKPNDDNKLLAKEIASEIREVLDGLITSGATVLVIPHISVYVGKAGGGNVTITVPPREAD